VLVILPIPLVFGGPLTVLALPGSMVVALHLARQGPARRGSVLLMLGTGALWLACTVFVGWLFGVAIDAADAFQPEPAVMKWGGPSILVGLGAFITFWATFVVSVIRKNAVHKNVTPEDVT